MQENQEPNAEVASQWWSDLRNIWTPVGWKDHLFRFNVVFNGTLVAQPDLNRRTVAWKGQGVQLALAATWKGPGAKRRAPRFLGLDDGLHTQGWQEGPAPVLWTSWPSDGLVLRQEVFAHLPGGQAVVTGAEPLFAWVRLSITQTCPGLPLAERETFALKINTPFLHGGMDNLNNLRYDTNNSTYPRKLCPEAAGPVSAAGWRLNEEDGRVRLGIASARKGHVEFAPGQPSERDSLLFIEIDAQAGEHVDLLVPLLPTEKSVFDRELELGYDRALQEANRFWSSLPETAARIDTPEALVNETIKHSLRFAEVIAERDPATGHHAYISGSLAYASLWATPHAMACVMLLDTYGYHDSVTKHLEMFRAEQGTVVPPGDAFKLHPGYLSSPKSLASVDWLSDHGAILYTLAQHALLSGDSAFTKNWIETIVKACEFIQDARAIRGHGGVEGLMPPAVANDSCYRNQAVWNDGWIYKGLSAAIKVLKRAGHPRAQEFEAEARSYQAAFKKALHARCESMPRWKDAQGREHALIPTALSGDLPNESREAFYLDTGPIFIVYSGLMEAADPLMQSALLWLREGPQLQMYRKDSSCWQVPCLEHEMSSCEPCYSWNVFHPHATADRHKFLEGMYSLFAGSVSRQTYTSCETRGGITGTVFSAPLAVYLARLAVIDDQIKDNELHLLRLAPLAWLRQDRETKWENVPTEFGPVSLAFQLEKNSQELRVTFQPKFRNAPERVVLHLPPVKGLKQVVLNGRPLTWDGKQSQIVVQF